jgi:hypothetical protein
MGLISNYVARSALTPSSLGEQAKPILETIGDELIARIDLGFADPVPAQVRVRYRADFKARLDSALRAIEIGFIGGRNMAVPMKDADRRAVILRRFYDARFVGWMDLPVDPNASQEDRTISAHICEQLQQHGLLEWNSIARPDGMGRITATGIDVIEKTAPSPIAISIDRRISVSGSMGVQIGDSNTQDIRLDAETIFAAVDRSSATPAEKQEAKGILQSVLANPLVSSIIGRMSGLG